MKEATKGIWQGLIYSIILIILILACFYAYENGYKQMMFKPKGNFLILEKVEPNTQILIDINDQGDVEFIRVFDEVEDGVYILKQPTTKPSE